MSMGKNVRAYRATLKWTLEQLAEASGVDIGTISALENRDSKRSMYATELATGLGLPIEALFVAE